MPGDQATQVAFTQALRCVAACYHVEVRAADALAGAFFVVGALLAAPVPSLAQEEPAGDDAGAAALAAPPPGVAAVPDASIDVPEGAYRLFLRSEARHDSARVERLHAPAGEPHEWRCDTPCALTLSPGAYRMWMTAVALDEEFRVENQDVFADGRPANLIELALGVSVGVVGIALVLVALLTGEGACFDFGAACPTERGPLALGAGTFAVALGIGLMFDSAGFIEITSVSP